MLWLFNPPCPDASPTHPQHGGTIGPGIGMAQSAPPFFLIRTGPETSDLPEYPDAIGEFRLEAVNANSIAMLGAPVASMSNNRELALWATRIGLTNAEPSLEWQLSLRSFVVENDNSTTFLERGWYLWYAVFSGLEPGLPPIYVGGRDEAGFDPLIGGRFYRRVLAGNYALDGQPEYVDVWPFWP